MRQRISLLILALFTPVAALAPNSRPKNGVLKTIRAAVSLNYQDSVHERRYLSDSEWEKATKSLNLRTAQIANEQQQRSPPSQPPNFANAITWDSEKPASSPPPSEKTLILLGCILAVNAGFLNGLTLSGILGPKMSVAAVTGAWTNSAVGLASGNMPLFAVQFSVVAAYLLGSLVNGFVHPEGLSWNASAKKPCSRTLLGVAGLVMAASTFSCLPLLALAIGMQTSWTSMLMPGNVLRSGHFSGITADSGTKLGQMIRLGRKGIPADQMKKFIIQSRLLGSFCLGGVLSVVCSHLFGKTKVGLMMSAALLVGSFAALNLRNIKETFRSKVRPWMLPAPLL